MQSGPPARPRCPLRGGVHRFFAWCDAENAASARLMRRLGMRQEARFVHYRFVDRTWGDQFIFAVTIES